MKILKCENLGFNPYNFEDGQGYEVYKIKYINEKKETVTNEIMKDEDYQFTNQTKNKEMIYSKNKEDKELIDHIMNIKITASERAKNLGLKNLNQMAEMTEQSTQTLNNWFNNKNKLFEIVLTGCIKKNNARGS
jgi:hypothetical protein